MHVGTELLEAFVEYASASEDRQMTRCAVQIDSVSTYFHSHTLTNHIKENCRWATVDLIFADTADEARDAIRRGADVNHPKVIHRASTYEFADVLIEHPEFINIDAEDEDGKTALEIACVRNDLEGAALLMDASANPNKRMACGCSFLHYAITHDSYAMMVELLAYGADAGAVDSDGNTPLHLAVNLDDMQMVDTLLSDTNAARPLDLQLTNNLGQSALYLSVGSEDVTELLLTVGAVPDFEALKHAAETGAFGCFDMMIDHADDEVDVRALAKAARAAGYEEQADTILEMFL